MHKQLAEHHGEKKKTQFLEYIVLKTPSDVQASTAPIEINRNLNIPMHQTRDSKYYF